MAKKQQYGIRYPFTADNLDNVYMDTNDSYENSIKSQVVHVVFTPRGQKLRDPDFGTRLIDYVFGPKDEETFAGIRDEISTQLGKYVPAVKFKNIELYEDDGSDQGVIVAITYAIKIGNKTEDATVAIKL